MNASSHFHVLVVGGCKLRMLAGGGRHGRPMG